MAFDKQALIDQLSGLTVLELVELVDGLKETWGVEAAAAMPMGMMMAGPAGGDAAPVEEQTEFTVSIKATSGDKKLSVIKEVRAITSLGLKEAKDLVEAGGVVKESATKDEAADIKAKLEAAGAQVEVK